MKVKLGIVYSNNVNPKVGYLVFFEEELYRISEVSEQLVTLKGVFDNSTLVSSIEELSDKYIKFIAVHERIMYSIIHGDYNSVINNIKVSNNSGDNEFSNIIIRDIIEGTKDLYIMGNVTKIYCRILPDNLVEIINLKIIDAYDLLDKSNRLFTVVEKLDKGKNTRYVLKSRHRQDFTISTDRDAFKAVGMANYKDLFTTKIT